MTRGLPRGWWDQVLDGRPYLIDLTTTDQFSNLPNLRAAAYREAEMRQITVVTNKLNPTAMIVTGKLGPYRRPLPKLVLQAPPTDPAVYEKLRPACNCSTLNANYHPTYCNSWNVPEVMMTLDVGPPVTWWPVGGHLVDPQAEPVSGPPAPPADASPSPSDPPQ